MKKRIVSILMAGVLAVSVLAGCSKSESDTQDASFVTESTEVGMTTETETETQAVENFSCKAFPCRCASTSNHSFCVISAPAYKAYNFNAVTIF